MARPSSFVQQRPLSLTEELERVEQQITLTLQEIDRNFSHAHRVVTSSILPIVEQYAAHSKEFWKQFFESSANVSLSGYEEESSLHTEQVDETATGTAITEDESATEASPKAPNPAYAANQSLLETSESYSTPSAHHLCTSSVADLDISSMSLSPSKSSTPRPHRAPRDRAADQTATFADYPSPYEALHAEVSASAKPAQNEATAPRTPGRQQERRASTHQIETTPQSPSSSPFLPPPPQAPTSIPRPSTVRQKTDPLLCRVLDRNYRIQATPLTTRKFGSPAKHMTAAAAAAAATTTTATTTPGPSWRRQQQAPSDADFSSSPPMAPPELHQELFSPLRKRQTPGQSQRVSAAASTALNARQPPQFWDDSDEDDEADANNKEPSPPKTMQFHVPQSRLLKTPAKEASRQMVQDILASAGVGRDQDEEDDLELDLDTTDYGDQPRFELDQDEASPSVVRRAVGLEDEIF